jgi:hypothetical protein
MQHDGNDAGHCANAMTARDFHASTSEERAICRKWIRGAVVLYSSLFLICTVIAVVGHSSNSLTRITAVSHGPANSQPRTN